MNTDKKDRRTKIVISLVLAAVVTIGIAGALLLRTNSIASDNKNTSTQDAKPLFSFTGVKDWRKGPSNETSMALFGKQRENGTSACFVSIEYKPGKIDATTALQKQENDYKATGGTMTRVATIANTLQTDDGEKQYELYQYDVTGGAGNTVMGGLELGYIQLSDGYVRVDGHCETVEELETTIPALQAYKLNS